MDKAVVTLGQYPGLPLNFAFSVGGTLVFQSIGNHSIRVHGVVTGLQPGAIGGWHVHAGFTCTDALAVLGHYYDASSGQGDPWNTVRYTADASGVAQIDLTMEGFTLKGAMAVMGRSVVFHMADSEPNEPRIGCGRIVPSTAQFATVGSYPGYSGGLQSLRGLVSVHKTSDGVRLRGTLSGLPASTSGGWHVHSGYSCDDAAGVFGHYFAAGGADPWTAVTYTSDSSGVAQLDVSMSNFSMYDRDAMPVFGRTGERATEDACCACGVLRRAACCVCACCCASCVHAPFL